MIVTRYGLFPRYCMTVEDNSPGRTWPDTMLSRYADMLSVRDVARVLNLEEGNVRNLLLSNDPVMRLPGVKLGKSWRIARDQLRVYLLAHHNDSGLGATNDQRGKL